MSDLLYTAQDFIPGEGSTGKEEEDEEDYSETETVASLGELSMVDIPEPEQSKETPTCETKTDKKLLLLAQQFIQARELQRQKKEVESQRVPRKIATPDPSKLPEREPSASTTSNPNVLPDFVSWLGLCYFVLWFGC